eukprot:TRINITY_DN1341_c5_g1_i1.p1 TRINITY_DN1341_c5_g1~~TRINITY_DN1341_c5_g1_i1.p1  ORF type:complete len:287 (+),score=106.34 TRINITY_DN1341_c5_g1_i1:78-938(+)
MISIEEINKQASKNKELNGSDPGIDNEIENEKKRIQRQDFEKYILRDYYLNPATWINVIASQIVKMVPEQQILDYSFKKHILNRLKANEKLPSNVMEELNKGTQIRKCIKQRKDEELKFLNNPDSNYDRSNLFFYCACKPVLDNPRIVSALELTTRINRFYSWPFTAVVCNKSLKNVYACLNSGNSDCSDKLKLLEDCQTSYTKLYLEANNKANSIAVKKVCPNEFENLLQPNGYEELSRCLNHFDNHRKYANIAQNVLVATYLPDMDLIDVQTKLSKNKIKKYLE